MARQGQKRKGKGISDHRLQGSGEANDEEEEEFMPLRSGMSSGNQVTPLVDKLEGGEMSSQEATRIRTRHGIEVQGTDVPAPVLTFHELGLPTSVLHQLSAQGCQDPTPVQMQVLGCALQGRDLIALAETGSGKTLAYLLPLLLLLTRHPPALPGQGPVALIVVPTRELVEQIYGQLAVFLPQQPGADTTPTIHGSTVGMPAQLSAQQNAAPTAAEYVQSGCQVAAGEPPSRSHRALGIVGGVPIASQIPTLLGGVDVLVATPGRLLDLLERRAVRLDRCRYLVLDEADRMLGEGMEDQLRQVVRAVPEGGRQTLLFSATLALAVERLAHSSVADPVLVSVGAHGDAAEAVEHEVLFTHSHAKRARLLQVLRSTERPPVLVFCNSSEAVDALVKILRSEQFHVAGLHAAKGQPFRFRCIRALKEARLDVMVATDVASRGLDVADVARVVNYDMPDSIESYIHRCGRTGRMGKRGTATSLLTYECRIARELQQLLHRCRQEVPRELQDDVHLFGGMIAGPQRRETKGPLHPICGVSISSRAPLIKLLARFSVLRSNSILELPSISHRFFVALTLSPRLP
eukprot:jgi/Mesen1/10060/ME000730S09353